MRNSMLTGLTVLALVATSCGGSDGAGSTVGQPSSASAADVAPDVVASRLIDELGSDDAAADALIIAMDVGYSSLQILDAAAGNDLRADGTIEGQDPAGPPLDRVLYAIDDEPAGEDEGAALERTMEVVEVRLASFAPAGKTPIERMRNNASFAFNESDAATLQILKLLAAGFTAADVVEALIFGIDGTVDYPLEPDGPILCARVVDEIYCPGGERFRAEPDADVPDSVDSEPVDEAIFSENSEPELEDVDGIGGLLDFSIIPGADGEMKRQEVRLVVDGTAATLTFDLVFSTGVSYTNESVTCVDNFRWTSSGSNLSVDGTTVTGTVDLLGEFDGPTVCPDVDQPEFGVPVPAGVSGTIDNGVFTGALEIDGLPLPFNAAVTGF